ncbi:hypothetical protein L512_5190 [Bordetella bronchiseptica MBORD624]|uniref:hypothetical protein n=1 Tax=Bordetella bronchiseptica TaxID=518 RepID=UPI000461958A|nr:hypothetical protein [Bordetella bronchiseptica]KDC59996.1 hypothetical protein L511_1238 [Bordetella bronchiseptica MBORD595]KDC70128.1 hypothetical protein L512_5190 [Bordetella bronchiseptica MBORD624]VEF44659.1 Uncharacterised protein [Bordetella bronchiseptica]
MTVEQCFVGVCFIPLDGRGQKFFGFSEFLAGLALMVLAWTIADVRYRFRVRTAPIPLLGVTFSVVAAIGVLALLTDLWRAEQWLVPKGNLLTPASWQALLGGLFLLTFLTWTWFAFIRPPIYGTYNAERYAQTLYRFILKGSPAELAVIADELAYSAGALVRHATDRGKLKNYRLEGKDEKKKNPPKVEGYANDLLLLIADKRLCRAIVGSSPGTALAVFQAMAETKKYGIQVETFAKNIVNEALANKDSCLYHEAEGYESGLIGYHKPLSQAMFANYEMVETIGSLLDSDIYGKGEWDAAQWEAYCRVVLMTFRSYVNEGYGGHSSVLYRAKGYIENAASDLYTLNELTSAWDTDSSRRLRVVIEFVKDAVKILDEKGVPDYVRIRVREKYGHPSETFYDHIASLIFEVIFHASAVKSPQWGCWTIQHNSVWGKLFNFNHLDGPAGKVVKFKVRRLLYEEIADMQRFPNFKGAKILGFCLNVMGLTVSEGDYDRDSRALQKALLAWTKKNFTWLHEYNPRVAEACLVDGMTYDAENLRLVRTSPAEGLRREPSYIYFDLDPASSEAAARITS